MIGALRVPKQCGCARWGSSQVLVTHAHPYSGVAGRHTRASARQREAEDRKDVRALKFPEGKEEVVLPQA
jgi:hypothetical protein